MLLAEPSLQPKYLCPEVLGKHAVVPAAGSLGSEAEGQRGSHGQTFCLTLKTEEPTAKESVKNKKGVTTASTFPPSGG